MSDGTSDNQEHIADDLDDLAAQRRAEQAGQLVMSARLSLRREQRGEAKKLLGQALKVDPTDIGALELLGDIFLEDAEQEKAIQVFEHGRRCHPDYAPFEEKLAQAHLDIAEMERDKLLQQQVIEHGDDTRWLLKKPALALSLSMLVPGAGQFYNDQWEKAALFFGLALVTLLGWFNTLFNQMSAMQEAKRQLTGRRSMPSMDEAINAMSGGQRTFFWCLVAAWILVILVSALEAALSASRFNEAQRAHLGL